MKMENVETAALQIGAMGENESQLENESRNHETSPYCASILLMMTICFTSMFSYGYNLSYQNSAQSAFYEWLNISLQLKSSVNTIWMFYRIGVSHLQTVNVSSQELNLYWSVLTSCWFIGLFIGSAFISYASEVQGRRGGFVIAVVFEGVGALIGGVAIHYNCVYVWAVSRLICGLGTGISCGVVSMFVQECTPTRIRGMCACFQVGFLVNEYNDLPGNLRRDRYSHWRRAQHSIRARSASCPARHRQCAHQFTRIISHPIHPP
jgi:hypothetical protein